MAEVQKIELSVRGYAIHCDGCESRIETVLEQLPGVLRASANHQTQIVELTLDTDRTLLSEVRRKLEFAGYATE